MLLEGPAPVVSRGRSSYKSSRSRRELRKKGYSDAIAPFEEDYLDTVEEEEVSVVLGGDMIRVSRLTRARMTTSIMWKSSPRSIDVLLVDPATTGTWRNMKIPAFVATVAIERVMIQ